MARRSKYVRTVVAVFLFTIVAVSATRYFAGGGRLAYETPSPDGRSRLEFRIANRWQQWTSPSADMLGYVDLHLADGSVVSSPLFDMSGSGPVLWTSGGVQVGTAAVYDPVRRRWSVY